MGFLLLNDVGRIASVFVVDRICCGGGGVALVAWWMVDSIIKFQR